MYYHNFNGWGLFVMVIVLGAWALMTTVIVYRVRHGNRRTRSAIQPFGSLTPEQLLDQDFARGDIDEKDYTVRRAVLHANR